MVQLSIDPEKVRELILHARAFDEKEEDSDPDSGSNAVDDEMVDALEDEGEEEDAVEEELAEAIRGMDGDEQLDLVALAWIGRGTFTPEQWDEARALARAEHNNRTAEYLLSLPMLGDYLEEGLAAVEEHEDEA